MIDDYRKELSSSQNKRLSKQCRAILADLQEGGVVTNSSMSETALLYGSRISDLRRCGYIIESHHNKDTGLTQYRLCEGTLPLWEVHLEVTVLDEPTRECVVYVRANTWSHARVLATRRVTKIHAIERPEMVEPGDVTSFTPIIAACQSKETEDYEEEAA